MRLQGTTWTVLATLASAVAGQAAAAPADVPPDRVFRAAEFGAVADGTTLTTTALQRAIDACAGGGGGTVYLAPGVYLSGTLHLKDHVRLYLEAGATLRGSPRPEDYPPVARRNVRGQPAFSGGFLVYAEGVTGAAIEGGGTIDGQGRAFWLEEMINHWVRKPIPNRPRALVCLVECTDLLFRDVTLLNSPCYTLWLIGCDRARIDGITIRNPHDGPNTDGIDIDGCRGVTISNCFVDGGDDAIAIKSDAGLLGADKPCEDIVVTNCVLCSVPACGIRIGYEGDAVIRNGTFSNLTIVDTDIGLDIISILPGRPDVTVLKGTRCENLSFSNITMRNVNRALFFWMGNETAGETQVHLRHVSVSNVLAECRIGSYIGGYGGKRVENVSLANVQLTFSATMPDPATLSGTGIWGGDWNPYGLYCAWVDGLQVNGLVLDGRQAGGTWRHAVYCEEVRNADFRALRSPGFGALNGLATIGLSASEVTLRDGAAEPGTKAFLKAAAGSRATVTGCDLRAAAIPFDADPADAVTEWANRLP